MVLDEQEDLTPAGEAEKNLANIPVSTALSKLYVHCAGQNEELEARVAELQNENYSLKKLLRESSASHMQEELLG